MITGIPTFTHDNSGEPPLITGVPEHLRYNAETAVGSVPGFNLLEGIYGSLPPEEVRYGYTEMVRSVESSQAPEDRNTLDLLRNYPPSSAVTIDDRTFYLSSVLDQSGQRKHVVGYTTLEDGTIAPRLFYKSISDASWRVTPRYERFTDEEGRQHAYYSKGETMEYGYVRETKLYHTLAASLERLERTDVQVSNDQASMLGHFMPDKLGKTDTYADEAFEVKIIGMKDVFQFKPGEGFRTVDGRPARDVLKEVAVDERRSPDFEKVVRATTRVDRFLGQINVETYLSRDGMLEWNMAFAPDKGVVWVNGVTSPDSEHRSTVTSYGTDDEVISAGVYDNKPIEYLEQVDGLEEGVDYEKIPNSPYAVLRVLDNLKLISEFREKRGVQAPRKFAA